MAEIQEKSNNNISKNGTCYTLANAADDLFIYTMTVTRPSPDKSIETKKVTEMIERLIDMPEDEAKNELNTVCKRLKRLEGKQGYPRSVMPTYVKRIQDCAVNIMTGIEQANECNSRTEYHERIVFINQVIAQCSLLADYVRISLKLGYINIKRSEAWNKRITNVRAMSIKWKQTTVENAKKKDSEKKAVEMNELKEAMREVLDEYNNVE